MLDLAKDPATAQFDPQATDDSSKFYVSFMILKLPD